jgi:proteasome component ECM29
VSAGRPLRPTFLPLPLAIPQIPAISIIGLQEAYPISRSPKPVDMAGSASSEARELNLVAKVEMRFALADSDGKLQTLLSTYLAPLLLKLASEHTAVRNKVITVCHHINNRLKSSSNVSLPVRALLKQFQEVENGLVLQLDLMFISLALERITTDDGIDLLPDLLRVATPRHWDASTWWSSEQPPPEERIWHVSFHYLLRLLPSWKMPDRGTEEDGALNARLGLSASMTDILAYYLGKFLLFDGVQTRPTAPQEAGSLAESTSRRNLGLSANEVHLLSKFENESAGAPGNRLSQTKIAVAKFLFTSVFTDTQRLIPAVILSSDTTNLAAFRIGDIMFKQCDFDLEALDNVDKLLRLYHGDNARFPPRTKLRVRILTLLTKSKAVARNPNAVLKIMQEQLFSDDGTPPSGLEAAKLRSAMFSFLNWVVRIGEDKDLRRIAPEAQDSLRDFIETQGWPTPDTTGNGLSNAEVELRSRAYESIGILAAKLNPGVDLVKWLFTSLRCDISGSQIHVSIEESLGRVLNIFAEKPLDDVEALKPMLLWNTTAEIGDVDPEYGHPTRRSTKFAAVRYANRCLAFRDVDGRWIDLLAVGGIGERQEMVEEGMKGLDPYWFQMAKPKALVAADGSSESLVFPDFRALVNKVFGLGGESSAMAEPQGIFRSILAPAIAFCRNILIFEALKSTANALSIDLDWERRIDALLCTKREARYALKMHLQRVDRAALLRLVEATLLGMSLDLGRCGEIAVEICSHCSNDVLSQISGLGFDRVKHATTSNNLLTQAQASRVLGILSSLPAHQDKDIGLGALIKACENWAHSVGQQMNEIRGNLLSSAFIITRLALRHSVAEANRHAASCIKLMSNILVKSRDNALRDAVSTAMGQLCLCLPRETQLGTDADDNIDSLVKDAKKQQEVAVAALGRLAWASSVSGHSETAKKILAQLYALHDIKRPELHFAVGEALAVAAAGWRSTSTITDFDVDADLPIQLEDNKLLQDILTKVIEDCKTTKPPLKKASAIWLLCLVQYCGTEELVQSQLRQCQAAFARLLSDRDEVVQESGSRGLSLVYEMGDKDLREDLVRDLVQSFTSTNTSKVMGGSVMEDTELFDVGALPTGEGSVTTYKDIVSLASEMGDPSLVYRFMSLASNNAIWTTRAAFGRFGLGNVLADSSYLTENKRFYPKLYRYRFDPNPNVQRSMNEIWKALVKDPNAVIDQNFAAILEDLLKSILGKEWRVREASCAAIADLIQGRDVEKYEKYLNEIWSVAFKVLDDIKETVRVAAMTLCRTLTNLLIRNLEVGEGTTKRAIKLLEQAIPFLLRQLVSGTAKDVQEYAIITLLQVVKKTPPKALRPFAPVVLETLVTSLSSLEHESINYLHLNADKYGLTAEKLDRMRVSSMNSSPITEAIDRCLESLDSSTEEAKTITKDAMNRLEGTFKTVIGLPSKIGLSRVLVTLTVRHSTLFRPYADRFIELVRKNILDRNETVTVAYSMSLAYMMRLASEKQVMETIRHAKALYFASEESSHRIISAETVHAISKVSNDVFMRFASAFLSFAFIGKQDELEEAKSRFGEAWKDNVGGSGAVSLYFSEIVDMISSHINSTRWAIKHACCLAVADLITSTQSQGQYSMAQAEAVWSVLEVALSGKTWEGKEKVVDAFPKFVKGSRSLWTEEKVRKQMEKIALREARRTNATYRSHAIAALGDLAESRADLDLSAAILALVAGVVEETATDDQDRMDVDSEQQSAKQEK